LAQIIIVGDRQAHYKTRVRNIVFEKLPQEGRERVYIESAIANQIKIQNQPKAGDPF
jgi:hypothetical protein